MYLPAQLYHAYFKIWQLWISSSSCLNLLTYDVIIRSSSQNLEYPKVGKKDTAVLNMMRIRMQHKCLLLRNSRPENCTHCRYQGVRPQPPGATELVLETASGVTVRKLTFAHWTVSHESSTRPPVSPELAFQLLRDSHTFHCTSYAGRYRTCHDNINL